MTSVQPDKPIQSPGNNHKTNKISHIPISVVIYESLLCWAETSTIKPNDLECLAWLARGLEARRLDWEAWVAYALSLIRLDDLLATGLKHEKNKKTVSFSSCCTLLCWPSYPSLYIKQWRNLNRCSAVYVDTRMRFYPAWTHCRRLASVIIVSVVFCSWMLNILLQRGDSRGL